MLELDVALAVELVVLAVLLVVESLDVLPVAVVTVVLTTLDDVLTVPVAPPFDVEAGSVSSPHAPPMARSASAQVIRLALMSRSLF